MNIYTYGFYQFRWLLLLLMLSFRSLVVVVLSDQWLHSEFACTSGGGQVSEVRDQRRQASVASDCNSLRSRGIGQKHKKHKPLKSLKP